MQLIGVAVSVLVRLKNVKEEPAERLPSWLKVRASLVYLYHLSFGP